MNNQALQTTEENDHSQNIVPIDVSADALVSAVGMGDVSRLNPEQRLKYIGAICRSVGLNGLTMPIRIIQLDGRDQLYATAECGAQLREKHNVTTKLVEKKEEHGCYIVTARASKPTAEGVREDEATGAVEVLYPDRIYDKYSKAWKEHPKAGEHLAGKDYANAIMKAETKAKRRAALSICGLGIPDESEVQEMKRADAPGQVIDRTETASDRAAMLGSIVEVEAHDPEPAPAPAPAPVQAAQEISGQSAPTPAVLVVPQVSPQPTGQIDFSKLNTPEVEPAKPEVVAPAVTPATAVTPTPAGGLLDEDTMRKVESVLMENDPTLCFDFLIAKGKLKKGFGLDALSRESATFIISHTTKFAKLVRDWVKAGKPATAAS